MRNYPYCGDWMLEPPDTSLEEAAAEQAEADAWEEFLSEGDPTQMLEEYIEEDEGLSCELISAYRSDNDAGMLEVARKMAVKLEAIAEGILDV